MKSLLALVLLFAFNASGAEDWQAALSKIPIKTTTFRAYKTEPVDLILTNFQPTAELRGVILMPGAADQLYFFDSGQITLPPNPTLLDAISALTNKADLRVTAVPPFLLIHMKHDTTSDPFSATPKTDLQKLNFRKLPPRIYYLDRPYDRILPTAEKFTKLWFRPTEFSSDSWHFYRLSFVGYDLSAPELLRALAYGTKTSVQVNRSRAVFADRPFVR